MSGNSEQCKGGEENTPEPNSFLSDILIDVRRQTSESLERTSLGRSIKKLHGFYSKVYDYNLILYSGEELHLNLEKNYPHWNEDRLITNGFEFKQFKFRKKFSLKGFPDPIARNALNTLNANDEIATELYQHFQQCKPKGNFPKKYT